MRAQYALLEKFEVAKRDERRIPPKLADLDGLDEFQSALIGETEVSLEEHKEGFRDKLIRMVDKLVSDADEFEQNVRRDGAEERRGRRLARRARRGDEVSASFDASASSSRLREAEVTSPGWKSSERRCRVSADRARGGGDGESPRALGFGALVSEYDVWSLGEFRDLAWRRWRPPRRPSTRTW